MYRTVRVLRQRASPRMKSKCTQNLTTYIIFLIKNGELTEHRKIYHTKQPNGNTTITFIIQE